MADEYQVSQRRACKAVRISSSGFSYQPKEKDDTQIIEHLSAPHPAPLAFGCAITDRAKQVMNGITNVFKVSI